MVKPKHSFNIQLYKHSCEMCNCLAVSKSVTLQVGVIYHRMDDIVQCLCNVHVQFQCRVSMAK